MRSHDTISNPTLPERLTERELSAHWRVSARTLQRWRRKSFGPDWMRIGSRILYSRAAVLAFEARHGNGAALS